MNIVLLPIEPPVDKDTGEWTDTWANYFQQQQILMQQALSDEGFVVPSQDTANIAILQNSPKIPAGTLIFDSSAVNGGSSGAPNGQLFIKLQDGIFHAIPNL
jgi:hypothetical protein